MASIAAQEVADDQIPRFFLIREASPIVPNKRFGVVLMHPSINSLLRVRSLGKDFNLKERIHGIDENSQKFQ